MEDQRKSLQGGSLPVGCKDRLHIYCVLDAGIVVNPAYPYLGASPDGKVLNPSINP